MKLLTSFIFHWIAGSGWLTHHCASDQHIFKSLTILGAIYRVQKAHVPYHGSLLFNEDDSQSSSQTMFTESNSTVHIVKVQRCNNK